jgi:hypothetical protein
MIVSRSSALSRWLSQMTAIVARPGKTYRASAWVRTAGLSGSAKVAVTFWNASGNYLGVAAESTPLGGTQTWTQRVVTQVAPPATAFVRLELRHTGSGTSWWDDLEVTLA